jgi:hypothetical protein
MSEEGAAAKLATAHARAWRLSVEGDRRSSVGVLVKIVVDAREAVSLLVMTIAA